VRLKFRSFRPETPPPKKLRAPSRIDLASFVVTMKPQRKLEQACSASAGSFQDMGATIMKKETIKTVAYWLTTGLLALDFGVGGVFQTQRGPEVMRVMTHLGYPAYFVTLLGVWKVLGGVALVVPGFPRLKEWAYAGILFDLTSAAVSLAAVGDGVGPALFPLLVAGIALGSYALRPDSRRCEPVSGGPRAAKRAHPASSQFSIYSGTD